MNADRDKSEPYWPPSATREPTITDEPVGDAMPVDEGRLTRYAEALGGSRVNYRLASLLTGDEIQAATRAVMAVADAEQADLRAEVGRLRSGLAVTSEAHRSAVDRGWLARRRVEDAGAALARVEALAIYLDGLAPGDQHYARLIRDALASPVKPEATDATVYASMEHDREIHTPDATEWPGKENAK